VGTVVDLHSIGNARAEYLELFQLLSSESALVQVKRLEFEESQYEEVIIWEVLELVLQTLIHLQVKNAVQLSMRQQILVPLLRP